MEMPRILVEVMDWLEALGGRQTTWRGEALPFERQSLALYRVEEWQTPGATLVAFGYYGPFSLNGPQPSVADETERVFLFVNTGGDGSYAGFWLDDSGKQWIVHHGSGSGSDWWGLISDNPKDLLRLMAIGYVEPAFSEAHDRTPMEDALAANGADSIFHMAQMIAEQRVEGADGIEDFREKRDELAEDLADQLEAGEVVDAYYALPYPPRAFQTYLKEVHGIDTPARASDFLPYPARTWDEPVTDPFAKWMRDTQPEPTDEELAQIEEMARAAEQIARRMENPSLWDRFMGLFWR
ncbi:hypothetical protein FIU86_18530 [Roseovarius sp. THAF9]|uniref:hypothetical protein n=1 Tax=Roseovarius sp. THAF9 TaxID=2587847 RepID=UPI0012693801|nr:hypothetical protein [Roseovarius sp. THAF9]QFT94853.1 hypothetical protein FIU86_18530 [Roseovarius sp. THAF9]